MLMDEMITKKPEILRIVGMKGFDLIKITDGGVFAMLRCQKCGSILNIFTEDLYKLGNCQKCEPKFNKKKKYISICNAKNIHKDWLVVDGNPDTKLVTLQHKIKNVERTIVEDLLDIKNSDIDTLEEYKKEKYDNSITYEEIIKREKMEINKRGKINKAIEREIELKETKRLNEEEKERFKDIEIKRNNFMIYTLNYLASDFDGDKIAVIPN